eukprot:Unigene3043_Nuclearia_a/m.9362 Unigene3043_Nuclearia_a/g.9362  ORF Unigene3043_Nuclearia_a/g.9362 Unigene3043_Nuclearia_a/m.9362 type:complete len:351 (+) Unigene3043_Nuclearia_a:1055-2107(+)
MTYSYLSFFTTAPTAAPKNFSSLATLTSAPERDAVVPVLTLAPFLRVYSRISLSSSTVFCTTSVVTRQTVLTASSIIAMPCSLFHAPLSTDDDAAYDTAENRLPICLPSRFLFCSSRPAPRKPSSMAMCLRTRSVTSSSSPQSPIALTSASSILVRPSAIAAVSTSRSCDTASAISSRRFIIASKLRSVESLAESTPKRPAASVSENSSPVSARSVSASSSASLAFCPVTTICLARYSSPNPNDFSSSRVTAKMRVVSPLPTAAWPSSAVAKCAMKRETSAESPISAIASDRSSSVCTSASSPVRLTVSAESLRAVRARSMSSVGVSTPSGRGVAGAVEAVDEACGCDGE